MTTSFSASLKSWTIFKMLYESSNASKTAKILGITQPGVSRSLAQLEDKLQIKLFFREKNNLIATPEADHLYQDFNRVNIAMNELENNIVSIRDYGISRLRLASSPGLGFNYAPKVIAQAFSKIQSRNIFFEVNSSDEVLNSVETDLIDIGFLALPANTTLECEPIINSHAVCLIPIKHPLANKKIIQPSDFSKQHLVIVHQSNWSARQYLKLLEDRQIKISGKTECNIATMLGFVSNNMGIGIINHITIQDQIHKQTKLLIKPFKPKIVYQFALVYKSKWKESKSLYLLRNAVKKINQEMKII